MSGEWRRGRNVSRARRWSTEAYRMPCSENFAGQGCSSTLGSDGQKGSTATDRRRHRDKTQYSARAPADTSEKPPAVGFR